MSFDVDLWRGKQREKGKEGNVLIVVEILFRADAVMVECWSSVRPLTRLEMDEAIDGGWR